MRRRAFITLLGGAAAACPVAARAQKLPVPVIGLLRSGVAEDLTRTSRPFAEGLREGGYVEGDNVSIEHRAANGIYERLPELATELVQRRVALIVAISDPAALAAKEATATIPIVFNTGTDPVKLGLVTNLGRPKGNLTGVSQMNNALGPKRMQLVRELVPTATMIGFLVNPINPNAADSINDAAAAAASLGVNVSIFRASTDGELVTAFAALIRQHVRALLIASDPFLLNRRSSIVEKAAQASIPAVYTVKDYATAGGLASYAANQSELYRQTGLYAARILSGARPADLPVPQPTKFDLVINLKTAKALGLTVPNTLLAVADEVIE